MQVLIKLRSLLRVAEGIGPVKPGNLGARFGKLSPKSNIKGAKSYRIVSSER